MIHKIRRSIISQRLREIGIARQKYIEVGDIVKYRGAYYKCVDDPHDQNICRTCAFNGNSLCSGLNCSWVTRADHGNVYFIRIEKPIK